MTLLGAEMRNIDERRRIVGEHPERCAGRDPLQALADLENRQRAEQAARIEKRRLGPGRIGLRALGHAPRLTLFAAALKRLAAAPLLVAPLLVASAAAEAPAPVVAYTVQDAERIEDSLTGAPGDAAAGRALYLDEARTACSVCHGDPETGTPPPPMATGGASPALDGVGRRLDAPRLRLWLVAPEVLSPATPMPSYYRAGQRFGAEDPLYGGPRLTAAEIEDLVAYLSLLIGAAEDGGARDGGGR